MAQTNDTNASWTAISGADPGIFDLGGGGGGSKLWFRKDCLTFFFGGGGGINSPPPPLTSCSCLL